MRGFTTGLDGRNIRPLSEHEAEEIADGLFVIYGRARENMLSAVSNRLRQGLGKSGWAARKTNEVLAARQEFSKQIAMASRAREKIVSAAVARAAATGNLQFLADMRGVLGNAAAISPNSAKVAYILADLNNSLNAAERRILRQFDDRYSHIIASASSEMATGTITERQAVSKALKDFADEGIGGFTDRAGRRWSIDSYAEMAVRTAIERATIAGYVDTMESYGYDLAVIDGHAGSCPICAAWEGVIISVSGENGDYPSLDEAEADGCFHPNCLHGIHTYYDGITHAPAGGFRSSPREVEDESPEYTARSLQRYMERQVRKYKDRMRVAVTPQDERQAYNLARRWQARLRQHVEDNDDLVRNTSREGGKVKLKFPKK